MFHIVSLVGEGINYFFGNRSDKEKTEEQIDTQCTEDPVPTDSFPDPGLECEDETQTDSAVPQESVSEAEEDSQKLEESGSLLDSERFILEERVRELEEMLREVMQESERKNEVSLAESLDKLDTAQKSLLDERMVSVQELVHQLTQNHTECIDSTMLYKTHRDLRVQLQSKYKHMKIETDRQIKCLKDTLNKAQSLYEDEQNFSSKLNVENSRLWSDLCLLQDAILALDEELSSTRIRYSMLKTECLLLKHELQSSETEETPPKENETRSVVMVDQTTSTDDSVFMMLTFDQMKLMLNDTRMGLEMMLDFPENSSTVEEIPNTSIKKEEDHSIQEGENHKEHLSVLMCDQMTSTNDLELVQVSQTEAEENSEDGAQLENEISDLKSHVKTLQELVFNLSSQLAETYTECEKKKEDCEILECKIRSTMATARKHERFIRWKKKQIEKAVEELHYKYGEALRRKFRLESNRSERMEEEALLREDLRMVTEQLSDEEWKLEGKKKELEQKTSKLTEIQSDWIRLCDEMVTEDREKEFHTHQLLKVQYSEMKEQHDKLEEDTTQLREAYSTLESQCEELKQQHESQMVNRDEDSVQRLEEELTTIRRECDEMKREREREQEEYNLMKARCQEIEKILRE